MYRLTYNSLVPGPHAYDIHDDTRPDIQIYQLRVTELTILLVISLGPLGRQLRLHWSPNFNIYVFCCCCKIIKCVLYIAIEIGYKYLLTYSLKIMSVTCQSPAEWTMQYRLYKKADPRASSHV